MPLRIAAKCREPAERAHFEEVVEPLLGDGVTWLGEVDREGKVALDDARHMRALLMEKGYASGAELRWVEDPRGRHNEVDWGRRFGDALPFLLK